MPKLNPALYLKLMSSGSLGAKVVVQARVQVEVAYIYIYIYTYICRHWNPVPIRPSDTVDAAVSVFTPLPLCCCSVGVHSLVTVMCGPLNGAALNSLAYAHLSHRLR